MLPIVILAGGYGTRLGDLSKNTPKSLVEICDIPFLHYQLDLLQKNGFEDIYMCLGHMQEKIVDFLKDYGNVKYSLDNQEYGTGGAIKRTLGMIQENAFFVIYGDSYLDVDYLKIQKSFLLSKKDSLIVIYKNDGRKDKSNVVFLKRKIVDYDKNYNLKMKYIDYGISIFKKSCFDTQSEVFDLSEIHKKMILDGNISSYVEKTPFYEVGSMAGIKDFEDFIRS